jgi:hypothetical protein
MPLFFTFVKYIIDAPMGECVNRGIMLAHDAIIHDRSNGGGAASAAGATARDGTVDEAARPT